MARYYKGILGVIIGKVGTVVGRRWRAGIHTLASLPAKNKTPKQPSAAQALVQARFTVITELATAFLDAVKIGFHNLSMSKGMTETNVFVKKNWDAILAASPDSVSVTFSEIACSKGALPGALFGAPGFDNPQQIAFTFDGNEDMPKADDDDLVNVFVYCPDTKTGLLATPVKRSVGNITITVPSYWNGMKVHCWGFVQGMKPGFNDNMVSDSTYLGSGNIS